MIYEERRTVVEPKRVDDYLRICRTDLWPRVRSASGQVICLLSGLIGAPQNEFLQIMAYPEMESWRSAQHHAEALDDIVQDEDARLLRPISSRPKEPVPEEDRRAVYGHRRFYIRPADLEEFVRCSEDGIWPRIESQGACILGLWTTIAATFPMEITILTGYHSPAHWEQTRFGGDAPPGTDRALWEQEGPLRQRRVEITLRSWVRLMRAHEIREFS